MAFTCLQQFMTIPKPKEELATAPISRLQQSRIWHYLRALNPFGSRRAPSETTLTFANNIFIAVLGWAIFIVVCIADVYALVSVFVVQLDTIEADAQSTGTAGSGRGISLIMLGIYAYRSLVFFGKYFSIVACLGFIAYILNIVQ